MTIKHQSFLEKFIETFLWKSRLIVILAVIFSLLSSFALFIAGSYQIIQGLTLFFPPFTEAFNYNQLLIKIIGAIDLYLIALVLLILAFGIYELFISKIDIAHQDSDVNILEITSLDGLKNRLLKVIVMVLVVHFFKTILSAHFTTPLEMLYLGLSILSIAACTFFIRKIDKEE